MPTSVWSGNLRLSLVLIPVKLYPASEDHRVSFRMIHEPSGTPIKYVKGIETEQGFEPVPEEEIIKGYEHTKGHHVLIHPSEIDELKLEAKHTVDMVRFVDKSEIDTRYLEKPYYVVPDGDEADEGYTVIREALKQTGKVAIGQIVMGGREHLVGIMHHEQGMVLIILRYVNEIRDAQTYFESLPVADEGEAVSLAVDLIKSLSGTFQPKSMPDKYAEAVEELVKAKIEQRAPEIEMVRDGESPKVVNIMAALKKSMEKKGRAGVKEAVRKRGGKQPAHHKPSRRPASISRGR
jgi:DNA end-binding protein Ku